jgi:hypothetical protein
MNKEKPPENKARQPKKAGHGTGQRSVKTEGHVVQAVRMLVADNNKVRKAAERADMSINSWAAAVLRDAAIEALKPKGNTNGKASS